MSNNQYNAKRIINLGLGKIGSTQISTFENPKSPIERFVAEGYSHWRDSELEKRRWVFATTIERLTQTAQLSDEFGPNVYEFAIPGDTLRIIRQPSSTWTQRGDKIYASADVLYVEHIRRVSEQLFPPTFREVLACRIAVECCEYITQSNTKKADADTLYTRALQDAGRNNAYKLGHEDITTPDENAEWVSSRWG